MRDVVFVDDSGMGRGHAPGFAALHVEEDHLAGHLHGDVLSVAGIVFDVNAEVGNVGAALGIVVTSINDVLLGYADEHVFEVPHFFDLFGLRLLMCWRKRASVQHERAMV